MRRNRLREVARVGTAYGTWCSIPDPTVAEFSAMADPDYVCVDCQHGLVDYTALVPMLQAMSRFDVTAIVRVVSHDPTWIGKALDAGAEGVIVPMVNTAEDAARVAAACRFPPRGVRSYGPTRAAAVVSGDTSALDEHVLCFVMIETEGAVANVDAIAATPGIDGLYIGPADLAISLGEKPGGLIPGRHTEAVERICASATAAGVIPAIHAYDGATARRYAEMGFRMVTCAGDLRLMRDGVARELRAARYD